MEEGVAHECRSNNEAGRILQLMSLAVKKLLRVTFSDLLVNFDVLPLFSRVPLCETMELLPAYQLMENVILAEEMY